MQSGEAYFNDSNILKEKKLKNIVKKNETKNIES